MCKNKIKKNQASNVLASGTLNPNCPYISYIYYFYFNSIKSSKLVPLILIHQFITVYTKLLNNNRNSKKKLDEYIFLNFFYIKIPSLIYDPYSAYLAIRLILFIKLPHLLFTDLTRFIFLLTNNNSFGNKSVYFIISLISSFIFNYNYKTSSDVN